MDLVFNIFNAMTIFIITTAFALEILIKRDQELVFIVFHYNYNQ